jgi:hypothetical protein
MRLKLIILFGLTSFFVHAQIKFRAIVPTEAVVEGESFRIQFVIEEAESISHFSAPDFDGFRVVNGPEIYSRRSPGTKTSQMMRNMVYTLQANEPGHYFLQGAIAIINGKAIRSNDVMVRVLSRKDAARKRLQAGAETEADHSSYLKPGEDPYKKIAKNLFIKVILDRTVCYPGEPVVATFKLYSRLQSRSDIIKNPAFYGFSVQDMINLDDHVVTAELVNGRSFDVHTIRKVQLYPLREGSFVVDAMEVKNRVEFFRSRVNRKTEQEIIEGVFEKGEEEHSPGAEIFETNMSTKPVIVKVRHLPVKNRPGSFNEATGYFKISSRLEKNELSRNEEGYLLVTVMGKGNFHQVGAPTVNWPHSVEGFEPTVTDNFDNSVVPLKGTRTFRFPFVANTPGIYEIPELDFSFFNPDTNKYVSLKTPALRFSVNNREKSKPVLPTVVKKESITDINSRASMIAGIIVLVFVLAVVSFMIFRGKEKPKAVISDHSKMQVSPEELLRDAYILIPASEKDFYSVLHQSVWKWLASEFNLSGTLVSRQELATRMRNAGNDEKVIEDMLGLLASYEAGMFTNASLDDDREELLNRTRSMLRNLKR